MENMVKKNADLVGMMELMLEASDRVLKFAKTTIKQQNTTNRRLDKLESQVKKLREGK
jgi:hypothetical protein